MSALSSVAAASAIETAVRYDRHKPYIAENCADTCVGDEKFFAEACQSRFAHKAGTMLHYLVGADERSCQRYAAGAVHPPAKIVRRLLRGADGFTWLCLLMEGCDAIWWQEMQAVIEIVSKFKIERR